MIKDGYGACVTGDYDNGGNADMIKLIKLMIVNNDHYDQLAAAAGFPRRIAATKLTSTGHQRHEINNACLGWKGRFLTFLSLVSIR